jgi:hypothetical protein
MYQWQSRSGLGQLEGGPQCLQYIGPNCQAYGFGYPASSLPSPQPEGEVSAVADPRSVPVTCPPTQPGCYGYVAPVAAAAPVAPSATSAPVTAVDPAAQVVTSALSSTSLWVLGGLAVLAAALLMRGQ